MTVPSANAPVVALGETMLLLRGEHPGVLRLGDRLRASFAGAESTVAIGLVRLGHRAAWIGRVGDDDAGRLIVESLRGIGVDVRSVRIDDTAPTGVLMRWPRFGTAQEVTYLRRGSAGSRLCAADVEAGLPAEIAALHVTGITPALSDSAREAALRAVELAGARGGVVSVDVNHRTRLTGVAAAGEFLRAVLPATDLLFCGADELDVLAAATDCRDSGQHCVAAALATGVPEVVIKHGRRGATTYLAGGDHVDATAYRVPVVDPVGAGDAFVAGYLSARLDGLGPAERLDRGASVAAFCVATPGDWEGLPRREELSRLTSDPDAVVR